MPFCKQCGNKLEENSKFCTECGTITESNTIVQSAQPINQELVAPPIQEVAVTPIQEQVVIPIQEPVASPVYAPVGQEYARPALAKPKKSASTKVLISVLAAIVTVIALAGVIMFTPIALGLKNKINATVQSPAKYYKSIEKQNKEVTIKQLGNAYDKYLAATKSDKTSAMELDIKLNASEEFLESIYLPTSLTSIELQTYSAYSMKDGFMGEYSLHFNDEKFVDVSAYFDIANKTLIASIPQLTDKYMYADMTDIFEEMMTDVDFSSFDKIKELDITSEELEKLLTRYTDILVESASDVKREKNVELEVGESTGKFTKITSILTEKDALKLLKSVLKEAKTDKTLMKFASLADVSEDDYKDAIDEALDSLEQTDTDLSSDEMLKIEVYVDSKGTIVGRNISFDDEYDAFNLGYYVLKSDKKLDVSLFGDFAGNGAEVTTSAVIKNEKYTGDLDVKVYDDYGFEETLTINYKDFQTIIKNDTKFVNGIFEIDLEDFDIEDSSIKLECSENDNKQNAKFIYVYEDEDALSLEISYGVVEGKKIEIPDFDKEDAYDLMDEDDMYDLGYELDIDAFLEPLEDIIYDYEDYFGFNLEEGFGQDEYTGVDTTIPVEDSYLYEYTKEDLIGEWYLPDTGEYFVFNSDGTAYLYADQSKDPLNCYIGTFEAYAPAYDAEYNMIPGLDIFLYFYETYDAGVDGGYKSMNFELLPNETGFEFMNFETYETFKIEKIY
ncbi:MAG: hypothetical protein K0R15_39 [Clostridiales bacterium]|jgi:hypothetical protein|nr:hypothetical protein [Clostridiales bacterium]